MLEIPKYLTKSDINLAHHHNFFKQLNIVFLSLFSVKQNSLVFASAQ